MLISMKNTPLLKPCAVCIVITPNASTIAETNKRQINRASLASENYKQRHQIINMHQKTVYIYEKHSKYHNWEWSPMYLL